ncbi:flippase-like domain-containing protein [Cellulomonas soli]|uniref:flippase-like domain-containing protein n=1 Tax=Cellulomonas soli TaxID=931535 RepID=UPI003F828FC3
MPGPSTHPDSVVATTRSVVDDVTIDDVPTERVHHPGDILAATIAGLGVVLAMVLATYAQNTTTGVAEDVQGFSTALRRLLVIPVSALESFVTLIVPLAVLTELAVRRLGRQLLEALAAATGAVVLNSAIVLLVERFGSDELIQGLSVRIGGEWQLSIPGYVALLAGLLTAAGPRGRRRTVAWSWNLVWVATGVLVITGQGSLPGIAVALLVGRIAGEATRYLSGVRSERAYGESLVAGVRRAGFEPAQLSRVPDSTTGDAVLPPAGPAALALTRSTDHRLYALSTQEHERLDLVVIDGDRQVVGMLSRFWRSLRLRGIEGRSVVSLRQAAERSALLAYAARAAGVRTPQLLSVAEAEDSMLLVQERPGNAVPLADLEPDQITDAVLHEVWEQLQLAHAAGIAHRNLTSDVVLVDHLLDQPMVWLTGWELGDVASSELARRMDVAQVLALLALRVGAPRAMESAVAVLDDETISAIGPLLQTITMPRLTRDEMRTHRTVLPELRTALVARLPEADVQPQQLVRFGTRTILTVLLTVVALFAIFTTINVTTISEALQSSDWRWSIVAFGLGLLTLVGAALALVAFAPVRISLWRATVAQTAATFVALAAPAGVGPAALNLRVLTRRGVSGTLAAATVALVQVSQFVVTLLLLLVLSLVSGDNESALPVSPLILIVIGALAALVGVALLIPSVRRWVLAKTMPTVRQTWPRLIEVLGQPSRLLLGMGGNLLMTLGYILAFDAALLAFGQDVSLIQVAVVYLAGSTAGSLVPVPGGVGATELALASALTSLAGVSPAIATSAAVLFRVMTYWLRIPLGWVAMRYMQRTGDL